VGRGAPGHFYRVFAGAVLHEGQVPDQHDAPRLVVRAKNQMLHILDAADTGDVNTDTEMSTLTRRCATIQHNRHVGVSVKLNP
jgi:hypothetical protein